MTARPAFTYRAARRNLWRREKRIWREGRSHAYYGSGFRYGWHASLTQKS